MARRTSRDRGRRPRVPPTPPIRPEPPTPTIAEERRRVRGRRRRAAPVEEIAQPTTYPGIPGGPGLSLPITPTMTPLLQELYQRQVSPYGTVAGPGIIPGVMPGVQAGLGIGYTGRMGGEQYYQPFTNIYAGQKPAEPWFMREGLGGRAGRAGEIMQAWMGGGRPQFVPKTVTSLLGVNEGQMKEMGYERTLGGSWRAKFGERPQLDTGGGRGGYGYTPSRYGYGGGGGGVRGQTAVARGMGLVNWRIGL